MSFAQFKLEEILKNNLLIICYIILIKFLFKKYSSAMSAGIIQVKAGKKKTAFTQVSSYFT